MSERALSPQEEQHRLEELDEQLARHERELDARTAQIDEEQPGSYRPDGEPWRVSLPLADSLSLLSEAGR